MGESGSRLPAIGVNLRRLAELSSRHLVIPRRLPRDLGGARVYVSPGARLSVLQPRIERADTELFRWARRFVRRGDTVWDVGANLGLFAFAAAGLAGPDATVVAIEADTWLAGIIRRSARAGTREQGSVVGVPVAVSDTAGVAEFFLAARGRASNFMAGSAGSIETGGARLVDWVPTLTIDCLAETLPPPDLIKIDVEGSEAAALRGAIDLLRTKRPVILVEVWKHNAGEVSRLLTDLDYRLYDIDGGRGAIPLPTKTATYNTLAWPSQRGCSPSEAHNGPAGLPRPTPPGLRG